MRFIFVFMVVLLAGCTAPDMNKPGKISKTLPDEYGVVCYATPFTGEFDCVKVK